MCGDMAVHSTVPRSKTFARSSGAENTRARGATLVEFLIILPVFLIIISGIVDFGMALRTIDVLSEAAKHGARAAAVISLPNLAALEAGTPLPYVCGSQASSCTDAGFDCTTAARPDVTLECLALNEVRRYLRDVNLSPSDWIIHARVCNDNEIGMQYAQVEIARAEGTRHCILCANALLDAKERAQSSFMLDGSRCR